MWPQLSVSGLSPQLTSVRPMLSPSFVPPAGFRESGRGKEGKKDDDDVWDLRRKKKKKNRASRGLNVIFALFCFLLQTAHWSRSRKHLGKCFRKSPHALHSNRSERPDEQTDQDYPQVSVSSYIQTSFALYGQRCSPS